MGTKQKFPDEKTVWVHPWSDVELPDDRSEAGSLILQSLLIHDSLSVDELDATMPGVQRNNVLAALLGAGLVQRDDQNLRCSPFAYPMIRRNLVSAGFPVGQL